LHCPPYRTNLQLHIHAIPVVRAARTIPVSALYRN
jgi:hypothetical protein